MNRLPKARTEKIVTQSLDKEILVYDLTINKAFVLNETLALVYRACADRISFEELKNSFKLTDDFIFLALDELKRENLTEGAYQTRFAGSSRREVIKKIGLASMLTLPLISMLIAPTAAQALSVCIPAGGRRNFPDFCFNSPNPNCYQDFCNARCCSGRYSVINIDGPVVQCNCF